MLTPRTHCQQPAACAATGAKHCRRCALTVNAAAVAAGRRKGGQTAMAALRSDPAFLERQGERATEQARALSQRREVIDRRAQTLRERHAVMTADEVGIPVALVPEYRRLRDNRFSRLEAVNALRRHFPGHFDPPDADTWAFGDLPMFGFDVIMADPPWEFQAWSALGQGKSPQAHYDCMPTAAIMELPVNQLAKRDCWLWLWATYPMIHDAIAVMAAWGFRYSTGGTWIKRGASGKLAFGAGKVFRGNAELYLIGRVGNPRTHSRSIRNIIEAPRGQHSEKPDVAYEVAEALFGPAFRADLFSRKTRPGWMAWGDQAGLLDDGGAPVRRTPETAFPAPDVAADQLDLLGAAA